MPQQDNLGFQPRLRLERRDQDVEKQAEERDHRGSAYLISPVTPARTEYSVRTKRVLRLQVARIGRLLDELEELTSTSEGHGLAIVGQSRAAIKKARETLQQWPEAERNAQRSSDSEDDPQPEVDGEMLERMYQSLNSDA